MAQAARRTKVPVPATGTLRRDRSAGVLACEFHPTAPSNYEVEPREVLLRVVNRASVAVTGSGDSWRQGVFAVEEILEGSGEVTLPKSGAWDVMPVVALCGAGGYVVRRLRAATS